MKRTIAVTALLAALASVSACKAKQDPNMPTEEESRELNNAAAMLDSAPDAAGANDDSALNDDQDAAGDTNGDAAGNGAGNAQ
jgi:hypothetical protein